MSQREECPWCHEPIEPGQAWVMPNRIVVGSGQAWLAVEHQDDDGYVWDQAGSVFSGPVVHSRCFPAWLEARMAEADIRVMGGEG